MNTVVQPDPFDIDFGPLSPLPPYLPSPQDALRSDQVVAFRGRFCQGDGDAHKRWSEVLDAEHWRHVALAVDRYEDVSLNTPLAASFLLGEAERAGTEFKAWASRYVLQAKRQVMPGTTGGRGPARAFPGESVITAETLARWMHHANERVMALQPPAPVAYGSEAGLFCKFADWTEHRKLYRIETPAASLWRTLPQEALIDACPLAPAALYLEAIDTSPLLDVMAMVDERIPALALRAEQADAASLDWWAFWGGGLEPGQGVTHAVGVCDSPLEVKRRHEVLKRVYQAFDPNHEPNVRAAKDMCWLPGRQRGAQGDSVEDAMQRVHAIMGWYIGVHEEVIARWEENCAPVSMVRQSDPVPEWCHPSPPIVGTTQDASRDAQELADRLNTQGLLRNQSHRIWIQDRNGKVYRYHKAMASGVFTGCVAIQVRDVNRERFHLHLNRVRGRLLGQSLEAGIGPQIVSDMDGQGWTFHYEER